MKQLSYLIIIFFLSCNQNKSVNKDESVFFSEGSVHLSQDFMGKIVKEVSDSIISKNLENQDCFFDQTTQTDDFLKGIKEFEGYVWNQEIKTATIKLSETETLEIYRGGCNQFELIAKFIFNNKKCNIEREKNFIFNKILWISKLLDEFDYKNIKKVKESNRIHLTTVNETSYYLNFMSLELYEPYFSDITINNESWELSFGFYY